MNKWLETCRNQLFSGDLVNIGFRFAVLGKGLGGLLEIIGGVLLLFLNPLRMNRLMTALVYHLFSSWPWQTVGHSLLLFGMHFSTDAQLFGVLYLLSHGVIKCVLMLLLWRKKWWAYPLAIFFILLFIAYQIERICVRPTFTMIALTVFDAAMIALTGVEYRRVRHLFASKKARAQHR